jgi:hypothetical protein
VVKEAGGWIRKNALGLVTLALMLLGVAVAWGATSADIGTTAERVSELRDDARSATTERATIRSDVRVLETRQQALGETIRSAVVAVDRLESVVSRLEALASRPYTR